MKMTFMGKNTNKGDEPTETKYTITFLNKDGEQISSTEYDEGEEVNIPSLPQKTYDDTNHYTYAWNAEPSATATADATYQVVETATAHTYGEGVVNPQPTCTAEGLKTYTCTGCDKSYSEKVNPTNHSFTNYVSDGNATCTEDGTKTATCDNGCGATDTIADVGSKTGHSFTNYVSDGNATCTEDGTKTATCDNGCGTTDTIADVDSKTGHSYIDNWTVYEAEIPATKETDGKTAVERRYCQNNCGAFEERGGEVIPATGVVIKVAKTDIGKVEGDLVTGDNKLAYGASYTVTAVPVEGATFVGWEIDGHIISREATYTATAYSNITITPVFEDAAADTITVTFYDKYGNTIKQYKDLSVVDYQAQIAADYDDLKGPAYPSYVFAGWDKDKDEILALSASTTIWANYEKVKEEEIKKYTVNTNATLILPDGIVNGQIPYDTQVTVKDDNATAWRIGEATVVAYGPEYTFYVGSDVDISPVYAPVEEKATTIIIGASLVGDSDFKYNIVATRNIPDGYEVIDYGFVYGKNLTDEELNLDKVGQNGSKANSGAVKAVHAGTRNLNTNEFALNYGITAKNAPITAKSFVTVVKGGVTEIVYSDMFTQNY
jgi:hypothetical protein